jgi:hypothetical protein
MPMDRTQYPENWEVISYRIRCYRANWRCEWCGVEAHKPHPVTGSMVILTVAHLGIAKPDGTPGDKSDKMDCREENLAALCPRCHLNYDRGDHLQTQAQNRARKAQHDRETANQLSLFNLSTDYE